MQRAQAKETVEKEVVLERKLWDVVAPERKSFSGDKSKIGDGIAGGAVIVVHQPQMVALRRCEMGLRKDCIDVNRSVMGALQNCAARNRRGDIESGVDLHLVSIVQCLWLKIIDDDQGRGWFEERASFSFSYTSTAARLLFIALESTNVSLIDLQPRPHGQLTLVLFLLHCTHPYRLFVCERL